MRVTEMGLFRSAAADTARARERLESAVHAASTGLAVEHPGDDPVASSLIVTQSAAASRFEALGTAASRASDELGIADGALGNAGDALQRARELALLAANDTWSASERAAASREVDGLFQQVLTALNTRVGDRYIFGGTRDDAPPFDSQGTYTGDANVRRLEVAPGILQGVSVRADVAMSGAGGGVDALATLQRLRDALQADSVSAIQATVDPLLTAISQVAEARSSAGASQAVLDAARAASEVSRDTARKQVSDLGDADAIDAASRLALAQRALESALTASASAFRMNILDALK